MSQSEQETASSRPGAGSTAQVPPPRPPEADAPDPSGAGAVAEAVTERHSVTFTVPVIGQVWLGEPKHLPFYAGVAALAWLEVIEWPIAAVVMVGKLLADNAHREILRDFGSALEAKG